MEGRGAKGSAARRGSGAWVAPGRPRTSARREAGGPGAGPGPGTHGRAPPSARAPVSWLARRVPCYLLGRRKPKPFGGRAARAGAGARGPSARQGGRRTPQPPRR